MPTREFFGLEPADDASRRRVPVTPRMLTFSGAVQGGAAFGAAIEAMEAVVARPVVWASAQFVRYAGADATFDIDVNVELAGRHTTQARARASVDGVEVLTAWGALGARGFEDRGTWATYPKVDAAVGSGPDVLESVGDGRLADHLEVRLARGRTIAELDGSRGSGHWAAWCRFTGRDGAPSAADLAVLGDLSMLAFGDALGRRCTGNSLDNSLRVASREPTGWVLLEVHVDAIEAGCGHAHAHLWTERGTLLAIASQTLVLREVGLDGSTRGRGRRRIVGEVPSRD